MSAVARVTPTWKKQKLFVSIFLVAVGLWFYVDGRWTWPKSNQRWTEHMRLEKEGRLAEWPSIAASRGWKTDVPHKYYGQDDILMQFLIAAAAVAGGAVMLLYWLTQKDRTFKTDAEAVSTPSGKRVPFNAITGVGLKKWESKGYARVRYELEGQKGEFLLDDYKFEHDGTHAILKEIEAHLVSREPNLS